MPQLHSGSFAEVASTRSYCVSKLGTCCVIVYVSIPKQNRYNVIEYLYAFMPIARSYICTASAYAWVVKCRL